MKAIYRTFILLFLSVCYACTDENIPTVNHPEEGKPVTLSMNLSFPETKDLKVETRTALSTKVSDFYLFIFNASGQLKNKYYFPIGATNSDANYSSNADATISSTTESTGELADIRTTTGESYILGVANVNMKIGYEILDDLNEITTMQELKEALAVEPSINPTTFTMSGYYSPSADISTDGAVTIAEDVPLTGYIHLVPVDAHITFQVKAGAGTGRNFIFTLDSWEVVNAPKYVHLFHTGAEADTEYLEPELTTQLDKDGNVFSFDFFVQERVENAAGEIKTYGERAVWDTNYSNEVDEKTFTNAPANATYVVLKGRYKGESPIQALGASAGTVETEEVDADVVYTVFLGEDSATDFSNFTTNRNVNYTYVVTVNGVKDISVEVRADVENRPDAEGDIILSQGEVIEFDAHYGAVVLEFTKDEITQAKEQGRMGYTVVSPYGNRIYVEGTGETNDQRAFADWVKFYKGTNVDDGKHYPATYDTETIGRLMTVKELLDDLSNETFENGDVVRYSAYINEYYYDYYPGTTTPASWKDFVNVDNRKLMILADTELSDDENSSITSAVYVLSQKSIKTIYNKDASGLSRAWGLESVEEPFDTNGRTTMTRNARGYTYYHVTDEVNAKYGRQLALEINEDNNELAWDMISETGHLASKYAQNVFAACMMRNRDLNGNGDIDPDEIRWYLPTLSQYQQMYIGMYGIEDLDARLYYNEAVVNKNWEYKHYVASNDYQIFWSEEGLSNCDYVQSGESWYNAMTQTVYMRCVRDLGTALTSTDASDNFGADYQFQDFYTKDGSTIELTYLNRASVRTTLENKEVSAPVTTFSINNRPAIRFQYSDNLRNGASFKTENDKADAEQSTVCASLGAGWRLPTLTELNLMYQTGVHLENTTITRTKFEFYQWNGFYRNNNPGVPEQSLKSSNNRYYGRYGHTFDSGNFMLPDGNNMDNTGDYVGYVRCVKDISR